MPVGGNAETGVTVLLVGFLIAWVPIVGGVSGLLGLIGFILVYSGRNDRDELFHRYAVRGANLFVASIAVGLVELVVFLVVIVRSLVLPVSTLGLVVVGVGLPVVLGLLSIVYLGYGAADRRARLYLWGGFVASLATIAAAALLVVSGWFTTFTLLSLTSPGVGIAGLYLVESVVVGAPSLVFAAAYARIRRQLRSGTPLPVG